MPPRPYALRGTHPQTRGGGDLGRGLARPSSQYAAMGSNLLIQGMLPPPQPSSFTHQTQ